MREPKINVYSCAPRHIEPKIAAALALLDSAVKQYQPKMVVGLMSGGDDSIPACYVASLHPRFSGILHVNTGIPDYINEKKR